MGHRQVDQIYRRRGSGWSGQILRVEGAAGGLGCGVSGWATVRQLHIRFVINISPYTYLKDLYTYFLYFLLRLIRLQHQGIGHAVSIDTTDINSASGGMARTAGPSYRQGPSHRHQLIVSGVRGLGTVAVPQGCRVFDQDKRGGRG